MAQNGERKEKIIDWKIARTGEVVRRTRRLIEVRWHNQDVETIKNKDLKRRFYGKERYEIVEIEH